MVKNPDGSISLRVPPGVVRWTLQGKSTAEEVWAIDWWTRPGTGIGTAQAFQDACDGLAGVVGSTGLSAKLSGHLPASGTVELLKGIYYRDTQEATYTAQTQLNPIVNGQSATNSPLQMSLCVTTLTGVPGKSFRGRVYLPATGLALDANRRFTKAAVNPTVDALKQVLAAGYTVGVYGPPVVVSRTLTVATNITGVRYDLKPDIQRRRANRQSDGGRTVLTVS